MWFQRGGGGDGLACGQAQLRRAFLIHQHLTDDNFFAPSQSTEPLEIVWDRLRSLVDRLDWDTIFSPKLRVTSSIPKSMNFRLSFCRLLNYATAAVATPDTHDAANFKLYMALPKILYGRSPDGKFPKKPAIERRLSLIMAGRPQEVDSIIISKLDQDLHPRDPQAPPAAPSPSTPGPSPDEVERADLAHKINGATRFLQKGEVSRAWARIESNLTRAPADEPTIQRLRELHPTPSVPFAPAAQVQPPSVPVNRPGQPAAPLLFNDDDLS